MADQDLEIRVRSTADLAALKQAQAAIDDLASRTKRISTDRGLGVPIPEALKESGIPFGEGLGGAGTAGLTSVAAAMDRVAQASLFASVNVSRARNELTTLVREMAAGAPTTRTLGALMGALGFEIAGLGIAMGAPILVASKLIEQEQRLNSELDQQLTHITDLAVKWNELARSAINPEGVQGVAKQVVPEIEKANDAVRKFAEEGIPWWKRAIDAFINIPGFAGKPFQAQFQKGLDNLSAAAQKIKEVGAASIHAGEESEKAFHESRVSGLIEKLKDLQSQQDRLERGPTGAVLDPEHFEELGTKIEAAKKKLKELIDLDQARLRVSDAAAKAIIKNADIPDDSPLHPGYQAKQQAEFRQHMVERKALEIEANAARASGDEASAKAIEEQLERDTFRRDQAQQAGERALLLKRDLFSTPAGQPDVFSTPAGLPDQFDLPEESLPNIYAQKRAEREQITQGKTDPGSEKIVQTLEKIYQQWQ